jgi:ppGpp synthetase/RelA/SpoT-type nucleotidyltranferase
MGEEGRIPAADQALFAAIFDYYEYLLDSIAEQLVSIGLQPTTRVKTTGTLIEKLKREHGIQLSRIAEFAGARIVCAGGRVEQDETTNKIRSLSSSHPRRPDVIDRRIKPSHGYRAVHVVVYPNGYPVEIQVRTELQDTWAQLFERFADQWGRQIRYGDDPYPP